MTPSRSASVRIASQKAVFSACISGRLYIGRLACRIRRSLAATPPLATPASRYRGKVIGEAVTAV